jgi:hypothetical protein
MTTRKQESDERLYSLPLEEFVSARDAAARELRKAGDRPEAERVKALRKPTVAAWAVNQLARRERMKLRALLQAGRQVRDAQAKVVRGGSPEALQQADERFSEVIADMSRTAARLLREDGHPATEATLERVSRTLRAASLDESQTDALERGTLSSDLDPAGFGGLVPVARTMRKAAPPERDKRAERQKREKLEKLGAEVRARRAAVERARASVRAAESELEREQARLAKAEEKLERMR